MAVQTISYTDKVDLNTTSVADINKVKDSDLNEIKSVVNNNATILGNMGKVLWTGSFQTGNITVPNLSDYTMIAVYVNNVMMLGNQYYGGCSFTAYAGLTLNHYGYRYTYDSANNKLTVDANNTGATDGTNRQTITKIVGIF